MNEIFLQNGKKITLMIISVRKFKLITNHPEVIIIRDENDNFQELKFSDFLSFKKGEDIVIKDKHGSYINFTLNDIIKISDKEYEGIDQKINKSCIFILPLLGVNYIFFDYGYTLYNAYVSTDYSSIYLKYKFINTSGYLELEEKLCNHKDFLEFYDVDKQFVIFKFRIDNTYFNDIHNIIEGKYSKIRESTKKKILAFHGAGDTSELGHILNKNEKYKKVLEKKLNVYIPDNIDLMSKINKTEELWTYQNISQMIGMKK
jgi:hypothetical protein